MHGTITSKELFLHWLTIVRLWGARCYLRCLRAALGRTPSTFLSARSSLRCKRASLTALFTSPRQHVPEGFFTSQEQRPARTSAVMRAGMSESPRSATWRRTSARVKPKQ